MHWAGLKLMTFSHRLRICCHLPLSLSLSLWWHIYNLILWLLLCTHRHFLSRKTFPVPNMPQTCDWLFIMLQIYIYYIYSSGRGRAVISLISSGDKHNLVTFTRKGGLMSAIIFMWLVNSRRSVLQLYLTNHCNHWLRSYEVEFFSELNFN